MIIYKVTNIVNGKMYIGQTVYDLKKRKGQHLYSVKSYKDNFYFHRAIRKYGPDNFKWKIIHECDNINFLDRFEIFYIGYYDTYNNGYNLTLGGGGSVGGKVSAETRHKLSIANSGKNNPMYGKKRSVEFKKKMSEAKKGKKNPNYGKEMPVETRKKISETRIGMKHSIKARQKMSIINSGKNNPNYGKCGKDSPRAKAIIINSKCFDTLKKAAEFLNIAQSEFCTKQNGWIIIM
jgi:group I intron endonuclease